jgi:hypothetical protein
MILVASLGIGKNRKLPGWLVSILKAIRSGELYYEKTRQLISQNMRP